MKKVSFATQVEIAKDYLKGIKYKDIMKAYGVNRWNIQDALHKLEVKTSRIKSPPRLKGGYKPPLPGRMGERYHDGDYLPPLKPKENNPVLLEDDLDIMERIDNADGVDNIPGGSYSIVVDENNEVKYEQDV